MMVDESKPNGLEPFRVVLDVADLPVNELRELVYTQDRYFRVEKVEIETSIDEDVFVSYGDVRFLIVDCVLGANNSQMKLSSEEDGHRGIKVEGSFSRAAFSQAVKFDVARPGEYLRFLFRNIGRVPISLRVTLEGTAMSPRAGIGG